MSNQIPFDQDLYDNFIEELETAEKSQDKTKIQDILVDFNQFFLDGHLELCQKISNWRPSLFQFGKTGTSLNPYEKVKKAFNVIYPQNCEVENQELFILRNEVWSRISPTKKIEKVSNNIQANALSEKTIEEKLADFKKKFEDGKYEVDKNDEPLIKTLLPTILKRISTSEDLSPICQHPLFTKDKNSFLSGVSEKLFLIILIEKFPNFSQQLLRNYLKIPGISAPFTYILEEKLFKVPLSTYFSVLTKERPHIISIGQANIGKSTLINQLYQTKFESHIEGTLHLGVDFVPSTNEFQVGYNIFDFQLDFLEKKSLFKNLIQVIGENVWILLHLGEDKNIMTESLEFLLKYCQINPSQIFALMRDSFENNVWNIANKKTFEIQLKKNNIGFFQIKKVSDTNDFKTSLKDLQAFLSKNIGDHLSPMNPHLKPLLPSNKSAYFSLEDNLRKNSSLKCTKISKDLETLTMESEEYSIHFSCFSKEFKDFSNDIEQMLNGENKNIENHQLHHSLFQMISLKKEKKKCIEEFSKTKCANQENQIKEMKKHQSLIDQIYEKMKKVKIHELVLIFHEIICRNDVARRMEFENLLMNWQEPLIGPYCCKRDILKDEKLELENQLNDSKTSEEKLKNFDEKSMEEEKKNAEPKLTEQEIQDLKKKCLGPDKKKYNLKRIEEINVSLKNISKLLDNTRVNREHFWREIIEIYDNLNYVSPEYSKVFDKDNFYNGYINYIKQGGEFEFIDGDNNQLVHSSLSKIFTKLMHQNEKQELFVISIIGPQSTGKSTLLNFLFNTNFQMSAGRCTQGLYASYFKSNYPKAKDCILLDSEGLLSIERNDETFDKKLTLFAMALSQIMIINVMGEINESMKKIIGISLFAANELRICIKKRPIFFFVLRNMIDDDKEKQREMIEKIGDEFKKVAELSKVELRNIVDYRDKDSFELMFSAYNKDKKNNSFNICIVNENFRGKCEEFRNKIFHEATRNEVIPFLNMNELLRQASDMWQSISLFNDILSLGSIKELNDRNELLLIIKILTHHFIDSNLYSDKVLDHDIQNKYELSEEKLTLKMRLNDIIKNGCDQSKAKAAILSEIETQKLSYEVKVKHKFDEILQDYSFAKELKDEYMKLIMNSIKHYFELANEEIEYKYPLIESKNIAKLMTGSIYQRMDEYAEQFKLNKDQKFFEEKFDKDFSSWAMSLENNLKKKLKTTFELQQKCFDKLMIICKDQAYTDRIIDSSSIEQASHSVKNNVQSFFEIKTESEIIKGMNEFFDYDHVYYNEWFKANNQEKQVIDQGKKDTHLEIEDPAITSWLTKRKKDLKNVWNMIPFFHKRDAGNSKKETLEERMENEKIKLSLICFEEIHISLTTNTDIKNIDTNSMKLAINQINENVVNIEKIYLIPKKIKFSLFKLRQEIILFLFKKFVFLLQEDQQNLVLEQIKAFNAKQSDFKIEFIDKLNSTMGDQNLAECHLKAIIKSIEENCVNQTLPDYKCKVENTSLKTSEDFCDYINKKIISENISKKDLFFWATDIIGYLKKEFKIFFDKIKAFELTDFTNKTIISIDKQKGYLKTVLNKLVEIFLIDEEKYEKIDAQKKKQIGKLLIKFMKEFFTQENEIEIADIYAKLKGYDFLKIDYCSQLTLNKKNTLQRNIFHQINVEKSDINDPNNYLLFLKDFAAKYTIQGNIKEKILNETKSEIDSLIYNKNLEKAIGCQKTCPYCGAKCTISEGHHNNHSSHKHRPMGFNGSWELNQDKKMSFLTNICDSTENLKSFKWKDIDRPEKEVFNKKHDLKLREKLNEYGCHLGKLNFTLSWQDPNDLDLSVICPCGYRIFFGARECPTCKGYLELDMNAGGKSNATSPAEHVYFNTTNKGIYKGVVTYYSGPKTFDGKTGGNDSNFTLTIHTSDNEIPYSGTVNNSNNQVYYAPDYNFAPGISFLDHCAKFYPNWKITANTYLKKKEIDDFDGCIKIRLKELDEKLRSIYNLD